jgi:hypothetical protein
MRLTYIRQKTGGRFSVWLLEPALILLNQYRPFTYSGPDSYIFPILNSQQYVTDNQVNNRLHTIQT